MPSLPGELGCDWMCDKCGNVVGQEVILATLGRCRSIVAMDDGNLETGELLLNRSVGLWQDLALRIINSNLLDYLNIYIPTILCVFN